MTEHEEWRNIEGCPNYQVSNLGRVRSLNYNRTGECRVLKTRKDGDGYPYVDLRIGGKKKTFRVHRLVARAFLIPVVGKEHVDHINSQRDDARAENLRYCSNADNHRFELARKHNSEAQNRADVKLKKARAVVQLSLSGELIRRFDCVMDAERDTGCKNSNICQCCQGKRKTAGGFIWRYA